MQTKGGGKHDILPAAEAGSDRALLPVDEAPRSRCGHVPQRHHGVGEHGGVHGASELRSVSGAFHQPIEPQRSLSRDVAGLGMIKQRRSSWRGSSATTAQLGAQDKWPQARAFRRTHLRTRAPPCVSYATPPGQVHV
jgi:hypothetical protein